MLIILFGLAASGKNYVGHTIAEHANFYFYDGDTLLSDDMRDFIREKKPFTQIMRDSFTNRMIAKIAELQREHADIVFAQALYKEKNREQLLKAYPDAKFIMIESTEENIIARLKKRHDWIDEEYAAKMRVHFDMPQIAHHVFQNNNGENEILNQFKAL